jgi:thioredoxin
MELREADFNEMVLKSDRPVLVDFWASWCPPCKMMQPVVDRLAAKVSDWADVYSINIDRSSSVASLYQITGVPTFVAFASGEPVERRTGALTEGQLIALLKKAAEMVVPEMIEAGEDFDSEIAESEIAESDTRRHADTSSELPLEDCSVVTGSSQLVRHAAAPSTPFITIVSGLPRSGTSLMMRMLNIGGLPALCDDERTPDADNPNGYYEFQDVKRIQEYDRWIHQAPGHSVKIVYSLLKHLPPDREYRVIFMRRHTDEILQSQRAMLERNGIAVEIPDEQLKVVFERELRQFYAWLPSQTHLKLINVSYNELLSRPDSTISHINSHLDYCLNTDAMVQVIDQTLYRNRAA